jgi:hypothetical protein
MPDANMGLLPRGMWELSQHVPVGRPRFAVHASNGWQTVCEVAHALQSSWHEPHQLA